MRGNRAGAAACPTADVRASAEVRAIAGVPAFAAPRAIAAPRASAHARALNAVLAVALLALIPAAAIAVDVTDGMRSAPILDTTVPPPLQNSDNSDVRRSRNYAMQPPVVPHKIDGYQLDKNANRCMFCHSRARTRESQAPMISVTHFIGRDGNFLAELSPRRYFCLQCHVPQAPQEPLIENHFVDVDQLLYGAPAGSPGQPSRGR
ncbi:MAG TPA: nitrate reductase cytochrome c-type subunit [Lautropia sp.]|nr:nitrate reductase cytochrome c-type subunit [Lautropia sp.]